MATLQGQTNSLSDRIYQSIMSVTPNRGPHPHRPVSASAQLSFPSSPRHSARSQVSQTSKQGAYYSDYDIIKNRSWSASRVKSSQLGKAESKRVNAPAQQQPSGLSALIDSQPLLSPASAAPGTASTPGDSKGKQLGTRDLWNLRPGSQVDRLHQEWAAVEQCRAMKRASEMVQHRLDPMYRISGSNIPLLARYHVNDHELQRLREMTETSRVLQLDLKRIKAMGQRPEEDNCPNPQPSTSSLHRSLSVSAASSPWLGGSLHHSQATGDPPHPSPNLGSSGSKSDSEVWWGAGWSDVDTLSISSASNDDLLDVQTWPQADRGGWGQAGRGGWGQRLSQADRQAGRARWQETGAELEGGHGARKRRCRAEAERCYLERHSPHPSHLPYERNKTQHLTDRRRASLCSGARVQHKRASNCNGRPVRVKEYYTMTAPHPHDRDDVDRAEVRRQQTQPQTWVQPVTSQQGKRQRLTSQPEKTEQRRSGQQRKEACAADPSMWQQHLPEPANSWHDVNPQQLHRPNHTHTPDTGTHSTLQQPAKKEQSPTRTSPQERRHSVGTEPRKQKVGQKRGSPENGKPSPTRPASKPRLGQDEGAGDRHKGHRYLTAYDQWQETKRLMASSSWMGSRDSQDSGSSSSSSDLRCSELSEKTGMFGKDSGKKSNRSGEQTEWQKRDWKRQSAGQTARKAERTERGASEREDADESSSDDEDYIYSILMSDRFQRGGQEQERDRDFLPRHLTFKKKGFLWFDKNAEANQAIWFKKFLESDDMKKMLPEEMKLTFAKCYKQYERHGSGTVRYLSGGYFHTVHAGKNSTPHGHRDSGMVIRMMKTFQLAKSPPKLSSARKSRMKKAAVKTPPESPWRDESEERRDGLNVHDWMEDNDFTLEASPVESPPKQAETVEEGVPQTSPSQASSKDTTQKTAAPSSHKVSSAPPAVSVSHSERRLCTLRRPRPPQRSNHKDRERQGSARQATRTASLMSTQAVSKHRTEHRSPYHPTQKPVSGRAPWKKRDNSMKVSVQNLVIFDPMTLYNKPAVTGTKIPCKLRAQSAGPTLEGRESQTLLLTEVKKPRWVRSSTSALVVHGSSVRPKSAVPSGSIPSRQRRLQVVMQGQQARMSLHPSLSSPCLTHSSPNPSLVTQEVSGGRQAEGRAAVSPQDKESADPAGADSQKRPSSRSSCLHVDLRKIMLEGKGRGSVSRSDSGSWDGRGSGLETLVSPHVSDISLDGSDHDHHPGPPFPTHTPSLKARATFSPSVVTLGCSPSRCISLVIATEQPPPPSPLVTAMLSATALTPHHHHPPPAVHPRCGQQEPKKRSRSMDLHQLRQFQSVVSEDDAKSDREEMLHRQEMAGLRADMTLTWVREGGEMVLNHLQACNPTHRPPPGDKPKQTLPAKSDRPSDVGLTSGLTGDGSKRGERGCGADTTLVRNPKPGDSSQRATVKPHLAKSSLQNCGPADNSPGHHSVRNTSSGDCNQTAEENIPDPCSTRQPTARTQTAPGQRLVLAEEVNISNSSSGKKEEALASTGMPPAQRGPGDTSGDGSVAQATKCGANDKPDTEQDDAKVPGKVTGRPREYKFLGHHVHSFSEAFKDQKQNFPFQQPGKTAGKYLTQPFRSKKACPPAQDRARPKTPTGVLSDREMEGMEAPVDEMWMVPSSPYPSRSGERGSRFAVPNNRAWGSQPPPWVWDRWGGSQTSLSADTSVRGIGTKPLPGQDSEGPLHTNLSSLPVAKPDPSEVWSRCYLNLLKQAAAETLPGCTEGREDSDTEKRTPSSTVKTLPGCTEGREDSDTEKRTPSSTVKTLPGCTEGREDSDTEKTTPSSTVKTLPGCTEGREDSDTEKTTPSSTVKTLPGCTEGREDSDTEKTTPSSTVKTTPRSTALPTSPSPHPTMAVNLPATTSEVFIVDEDSCGQPQLQSAARKHLEGTRPHLVCKVPHSGIQLISADADQDTRGSDLETNRPAEPTAGQNNGEVTPQVQPQNDPVRGWWAKAPHTAAPLTADGTPAIPSLMLLRGLTARSVLNLDGDQQRDSSQLYQKTVTSDSQDSPGGSERGTQEDDDSTLYISKPTLAKCVAKNAEESGSKQQSEPSLSPGIKALVTVLPSPRDPCPQIPSQAGCPRRCQSADKGRVPTEDKSPSFRRVHSAHTAPEKPATIRRVHSARSRTSSEKQPRKSRCPPAKKKSSGKQKADKEADRKTLVLPCVLFDGDSPALEPRTQAVSTSQDIATESSSQSSRPPPAPGHQHTPREKLGSAKRHKKTTDMFSSADAIGPSTTKTKNGKISASPDRKKRTESGTKKKPVNVDIRIDTEGRETTHTEKKHGRRKRKGKKKGESPAGTVKGGGKKKQTSEDLDICLSSKDSSGMKSISSGISQRGQTECFRPDDSLSLGGWSTAPSICHPELEQVRTPNQKLLKKGKKQRKTAVDKQDPIATHDPAANQPAEDIGRDMSSYRTPLHPSPPCTSDSAEESELYSWDVETEEQPQETVTQDDQPCQPGEKTPEDLTPRWPPTGVRGRLDGSEHPEGQTSGLRQRQASPRQGSARLSQKYPADRADRSWNHQQSGGDKYSLALSEASSQSTGTQDRKWGRGTRRQRTPPPSPSSDVSSLLARPTPWGIGGWRKLPCPRQMAHWRAGHPCFPAKDYICQRPWRRPVRMMRTLLTDPNAIVSRTMRKLLASPSQDRLHGTGVDASRTGGQDSPSDMWKTWSDRGLPSSSNKGSTSTKASCLQQKAKQGKVTLDGVAKARHSFLTLPELQKTEARSVQWSTPGEVGCADHSTVGMTTTTNTTGSVCCPQGVENCHNVKGRSREPRQPADRGGEPEKTEEERGRGTPTEAGEEGSSSSRQEKKAGSKDFLLPQLTERRGKAHPKSASHSPRTRVVNLVLDIPADTAGGQSVLGLCSVTKDQGERKATASSRALGLSRRQRQLLNQDLCVDDREILELHQDITTHFLNLMECRPPENSRHNPLHETGPELQQGTSESKTPRSRKESSHVPYFPSVSLGEKPSMRNVAPTHTAVPSRPVSPEGGGQYGKARGLVPTSPTDTTPAAGGLDLLAQGTTLNRAPQRLWAVWPWESPQGCAGSPEGRGSRSWSRVHRRAPASPQREVPMTVTEDAQRRSIRLLLQDSISTQAPRGAEASNVHSPQGLTPTAKGSTRVQRLQSMRPKSAPQYH